MSVHAHFVGYADRAFFFFRVRRYHGIASAFARVFSVSGVALHFVDLCFAMDAHRHLSQSALEKCGTCRNPIDVEIDVWRSRVTAASVPDPCFCRFQPDEVSGVPSSRHLCIMSHLFTHKQGIRLSPLMSFRCSRCRAHGRSRARLVVSCLSVPTLQSSEVRCCDATPSLMAFYMRTPVSITSLSYVHIHRSHQCAHHYTSTSPTPACSPSSTPVSTTTLTPSPKKSSPSSPKIM